MDNIIKQIAMYNLPFILLIILTVVSFVFLIAVLIKGKNLLGKLLIFILTAITIILIVGIININQTRKDLLKNVDYKTTTISSIESKKHKNNLNIYRVNTWELGRNQLIATNEKLSKGDIIKYKQLGDHIKFDKKNLKTNDLNKKRLMSFNYKYKNMETTVNQIINFKANDAFEKKPKMNIVFYNKNDKKINEIKNVEKQFKISNDNGDKVLLFDENKYNKKDLKLYYMLRISKFKHIDNFEIKLKM